MLVLIEKPEDDCELESKRINFEMSPRCNQLLTRAAEQNKRSKRQEASKRLEHHLEYFLNDWIENEK
jgi:hypothetical protein